MLQKQQAMALSNYTDIYDLVVPEDNMLRKINQYSKFYDNLFDDWANDEAIPLLYSRDKIEEATDHTIHLVPE